MCCYVSSLIQRTNYKPVRGVSYSSQMRYHDSRSSGTSITWFGHFLLLFNFPIPELGKNINHKIELCRDINGYGVISRAKCDQKAVFKINLFFIFFV